MLIFYCSGFKAFSQSVEELYIKKGVQPILLYDELLNNKSIDISTNSFSIGGQLSEKNFIKNFNDLTLVPIGVFRKGFVATPTFNHFTLFFAIKNITTENIKLYYRCGSPLILKISEVAKEKFTYTTAGFTGNNELSDRFNPSDFVPILIEAGATSCFMVELQYSGSYRHAITPMLFSYDGFRELSLNEVLISRPQIIVHMLILGGILVMALFMISQFSFYRDNSYLYYALYSVTIFLFFERIFEVNCNIRLISQLYPTYVYYAHIIYQLLVTFFYIAFLKEILTISKKDNLLYRYCNALQLIVIGVLFMYIVNLFIVEDNVIFISFLRTVCTVLSGVTLLSVFLILLFRPHKTRVIWYILAGFGCLTLAALIVIYLNRTGKNVYYTALQPVTILEAGALAEVIFFGFALGYKSKLIKNEKNRIEYQIKEAEMAALKAQMNPHFMFNCINSIDAFIHSNDKYNATLYLNKFARLLRNILESSKENTVPISTDVDTLKLYVELEELRHESRFVTIFNIDDELLSNDYKVPPLIVQPFVENAIQHGLVNKQAGMGELLIHIKREGEIIQYIISDNGVGRKVSGQIKQNKESHLGMQMSYERIKLFNKEATASVTIEDLYDMGTAAGTKVTVNLNII
jgi:hypothetical protein